MTSFKYEWKRGTVGGLYNGEYGQILYNGEALDFNLKRVLEGPGIKNGQEVEFLLDRYDEVVTRVRGYVAKKEEPKKVEQPKKENTSKKLESK